MPSTQKPPKSLRYTFRGIEVQFSVSSVQRFEELMLIHDAADYTSNIEKAMLRLLRQTNEEDVPDRIREIRRLRHNGAQLAEYWYARGFRFVIEWSPKVLKVVTVERAYKFNGYKVEHEPAEVAPLAS